MQIYGLYDPDTDCLRYVGKANDSAERLKTHIREARTQKRPVCRWVKSLIDGGKLPVLRVIEEVHESKWEEAERRLIAEYRKTCDLLNLADGGAMPSQTIEQRKTAAKASNRLQATKPDAWKRLVQAKQHYARLAKRVLKSGDVFGYWCMRIKMHNRAVAQPHLFGGWIINGR